MGLGLIDGTLPFTQYDLTRIGGLPPSTTRGLATGYVGVSTTAAAPIRATTYAAQGAAAQRSFSSTSANDTAAGTGARTISWSYLNTSFALLTETVTLNGTTPVNTVSTDSAYAEAMIVATCGSTGGNVGTVNVFVATAGGGGSWGSIAAQDGQTFWAQHYVPAGVSMYLLGVYGGLLTGGTTLTNQVPGVILINRQQNPSAANLPQKNVAGSYVYGGDDVSQKFDLGLPVVGPDLVFLIGRAGNTPGIGLTNTIYGTFEYVQF